MTTTEAQRACALMSQQRVALDLIRGRIGFWLSELNQDIPPSRVQDIARRIQDASGDMSHIAMTISNCNALLSGEISPDERGYGDGE